MNPPPSQLEPSATPPATTPPAGIPPGMGSPLFWDIVTKGAFEIIKNLSAAGLIGPIMPVPPPPPPSQGPIT